MKKRFISIALMLLLMLSILPAAFADVTYPAPGDIEAGSSLDHLVAIVSSGSTVSAAAETLPNGVQLETAEKPDGLYVYLRGTPNAVGVYNCVINVNGSGSLICPVTVIPAKPVLTPGPGVKCRPGDSVQVSVEASVADGGALSYQWYSNHNNNTSSGMLISGATGSSCAADTSVIGTTYYYCLVSNSSSGKTSSALSPTIPVTVEELSVTSISVQSMPSKLSYTVGDTLDTTGLLLYVNFSDGSSTVISEGFTVSPTRLERPGVQTIELSYKGQTCSFTVGVKEADEVIEGIGVLSLPLKTEYTVGETLETAGLSIRVYTNNGHRDVYESLECYPTVFEKAGPQTISVSYGGKTCTFSVTVVEEEKPVSLAVASRPTKTVYTVGDTLETDGLTLRLTTSRNRTEEISSGFTCTPTLLDKAGRQDILVEYGELSCRFSVTVQEKESEVSPAPSTSPEAIPSPTPHISQHQPHKTGSSKVLVIVIIVAALLALAGLGVYVFIMNRGGVQKFTEKLREIVDRFRKH